jgi:UDP:flavonoid glycosyltransferase YjiC (YdhE family)
MLRDIADRHKELFFDVFYAGRGLPESSNNFASHGYVPNLYEYLALARIAIVHGGLTTLHEAMLFEKPVMIVMDPFHPEQQNNARKIVAIGAGTSVDGRSATCDVLEKKIAETMKCCPRPIRKVHPAMTGRKSAAEIILAAANRGQS